MMIANAKYPPVTRAITLAIAEEARKLLKDERITLAITLAVKKNEQSLLLAPSDAALLALR